MVTSRILGPDGQPIELASLAEPQTSRVGQLHQEWQGHPSRGLTPTKLSALLVAAEQGDVIAQYELFEDMEERDGHILAEMGKRRRAVAGLQWDIVPPPNASAAEKKAADQLKEMLDEVDDIEGALFDTTDAIGKGFACQEIAWARDGRHWLPASITHRPQSWFRLYRGYTQEIRLRDNSADGAPLIPFGWITHIHKARSGYIERASLFRSLVWPYLFKNYSVGDLAEFLEIYGIPLRIGKYPSGASEKEKLTLLRALVSIGHNAAGIVPEGMALDFHKTADGDAAAFALMMDWCERTESKVILGGTLTSQADGKSSTNALGNVHNEVRKELKDADAKLVAASWTRELVYPIAALNGLAPDGLRRSPRFRIDTAETKDIGVFATALPPLVEMGMQIPVDWAHSELGIPEAEGDQPVLQKRPAPAPPAAPAMPAEAGGDGQAAAKAQRPREQPLEERIAERLGNDGNAIVEGWLNRLQQAVEASPDLASFRARLDAEFEDLPTEQLGTLVAQALLTAELGGRASVQDEFDAERNA